ncbi:hypothetical protein QBC42DRAFT_294576 [Cladorrhinum samala]|uniref:Fork-head domain-containing protein n=1 Tax=Cladorrhinum samala TaxID=585594 RepID=A0AAV9HWR1_9PEZI|nr:hypothetical protein QBC42DRAFT_294576 [Cladorrhinum samala]
MTLYTLYQTGGQECSSDTIRTHHRALVMEPELSDKKSNSNNTRAAVSQSTAPAFPPSTSSQTPSTMSPFESLETMYPTTSPPRVIRTSTSSSDAGHLLPRDEEDFERGYLSAQARVGDSMWGASAGSQAGSDGFDNYALHSSPALHGLPLQDGATGASPRTSAWTASDQHVRSASWERFQSHGSHALTSFQLRESFAQDGLDLPMTTFQPENGLPCTPMHSFDGSEGSFLLARSQTEPHQTSQYPAPDDGVPTPESSRGLSPCSTTLGFKMEDDMVSPATGSGTIEDISSARSAKDSISGPESHSQLNSTAPSPAGGGGAPSSLGGASNSKGEEPYAKLIYRAFMSKPSRAMTLQEIYQWFRENTDKGKDDSKGWQNSIRHNLSMNQAFAKRERRSSKDESTNEAGGSSPPKVCLAAGAASSSSSTTENKKSTEWFLQDWAVENGVQSTTRYRKGNSCSAAGSSGVSNSLSGRRGASSMSPSSLSRHSSSHPYRSYHHSRMQSTSEPGFPRRSSSSSRGRFPATHTHGGHGGVVTFSGRIRNSSRPGGVANNSFSHRNATIHHHHAHHAVAQQQMQGYHFPHHQQPAFYSHAGMLPEQHQPEQQHHHQYNPYVGFQPHLLKTDRVTIGLDFHPQHPHEHDFSAATDPQLFIQQQQQQQQQQHHHHHHNRTPSLNLEGGSESEPAPLAGVDVVVSGMPDMMALQLPEPRQTPGGGNSAAAAHYFASTSTSTSTNTGVGANASASAASAVISAGDLSAYSMPVGVYEDVVERYGWGAAAAAAAAAGGATNTNAAAAAAGTSGSLEDDCDEGGIGTVTYQY